jgi:hypothetical protein
LNACPYRATVVLHRRPRVPGSMEATTSLTRGGIAHRPDALEAADRVVSISHLAPIPTQNPSAAAALRTNDP